MLSGSLNNLSSTLPELHKAVLTPLQSGSIDLLVGSTNTSHHLEILDPKFQRQGLRALRSKFGHGWLVMGPLCPDLNEHDSNSSKLPIINMPIQSDQLVFQGR